MIHSPSPPHTAFAGGNLTDGLIERAKQNRIALHGTNVNFS